MTTITENLQHLNKTGSQLNHSFLESFLESFSDGVLILTLSGELLHANKSVYSILERYASLINQNPRFDEAIAHLRKLIVEQPALYRQAPSFIESDLKLPRVGILRIRARRFQISAIPIPLLWVSVEDLQQSLSAQALVEAEKYGLSDRETEVWRLRKAKCTYLEIAGLLYISINTVKKHLGNITSKIERYECHYTHQTDSQVKQLQSR